MVSKWLYKMTFYMYSLSEILAPLKSIAKFLTDFRGARISLYMYCKSCLIYLHGKKRDFFFHSCYHLQSRHSTVLFFSISINVSWIPVANLLLLVTIHGQDWFSHPNVSFQGSNKGIFFASKLSKFYLKDTEHETAQCTHSHFSWYNCIIN